MRLGAIGYPGEINFNAGKNLARLVGAELPTEPLGGIAIALAGIATSTCRQHVLRNRTGAARDRNWHKMVGSQSPRGFAAVGTMPIPIIETVLPVVGGKVTGDLLTARAPSMRFCQHLCRIPALPTMAVPPQFLRIGSVVAAAIFAYFIRMIDTVKPILLPHLIKIGRAVTPVAFLYFVSVLCAILLLFLAQLLGVLRAILLLVLLYIFGIGDLVCSSFGPVAHRTKRFYAKRRCSVFDQLRTGFPRLAYAAHLTLWHRLIDDHFTRSTKKPGLPTGPNQLIVNRVGALYVQQNLFVAVALIKHFEPVRDQVPDHQQCVVGQLVKANGQIVALSGQIVFLWQGLVEVLDLLLNKLEEQIMVIFGAVTGRPDDGRCGGWRQTGSADEITGFTSTPDPHVGVTPFRSDRALVGARLGAHAATALRRLYGLVGCLSVRRRLSAYGTLAYRMYAGVVTLQAASKMGAGEVEFIVGSPRPNAHRFGVQSRRWAFLSYSYQYTRNRVTKQVKKAHISALFSGSALSRMVMFTRHPSPQLALIDGPSGAPDFFGWKNALLCQPPQRRIVVPRNDRRLLQRKPFILFRHISPPCDVLYTLSCMKIVCMITYLRILFAPSGDYAMSNKLIAALLVVIVVLLVGVIALLSLITRQNDLQNAPLATQQQIVVSTAAFATAQQEIMDKCRREHPTKNELGTVNIGPLTRCLLDNGYKPPKSEESK